MATSTVTLYKVGFNMQQNAIIDNIETYLSTEATKYTPYTNVQYMKPELDMTIRLPINQSVNKQLYFNYVEIVNSDDSASWYYYVLDSNWLSEKSLEIQLTMDTLNTFNKRNYLNFTANTIIHRQHKERFEFTSYSYTRTTINRKIDLTPEVTGLPKYLSGESGIAITQPKWYLIYTNDNSDPAINSVVNCWMLPDSKNLEGTSVSVKISMGSQEYSYTTWQTATTGDFWLFKDTHNILQITTTGGTTLTKSIVPSRSYYITSNAGQSYSTLHEISSDADDQPTGISWKFTKIVFANTAYATAFAQSNGSILSMSYTNLLNFCRNSTSGNITYTAGGEVTLSNITNIDRTDLKLVKIIECPYCPITMTYDDDTETYTLPAGFSVTITNDLNANQSVCTIAVEDLSYEFENTIATDSLSQMVCTIPAFADRKTASKSMEYESKLFHSDAYSLIYSYDSFTREVPLEQISPWMSFLTPGFNITYKQSNTISSNLGFKFTPVESSWYNKTDMYSNFLIANRNNESPIFNSSYLEYIKVGYNYDKKAKHQQDVSNWIGTVLQGVGAVGSALVGGIGYAAAISLGTSAISSVASNIQASITAQRNIEQKIVEAKATANSVSASDDLNLLNWYNYNKLRKNTYRVSDEIRTKLYNLYFLTGYACEKAGIPDTTSRYRFNYVQCTPDFVEKDMPAFQPYIADISARFEKGVTYFHTYEDFAQNTYENWEVRLISSM